MSIAEDIAEHFNGDGQQFTDSDGIEIDVLLVQLAYEVCTYNTSSLANGVEIYRLRDGSHMVVCDYWDILTREQGVTPRAAELIEEAEVRGRDIDDSRIAACWVDSNDEVWALEDIDGDLRNPHTWERI